MNYRIRIQKVKSPHINIPDIIFGYCSELPELNKVFSASIEIVNDDNYKDYVLFRTSKIVDISDIEGIKRIHTKNSVYEIEVCEK